MAQPDISYSNTVSSFLENRKTYTAYRTKQLDEKKQIDGRKSNVLSTVQKNMSAQALKSFEKVLQHKKFKTK